MSLGGTLTLVTAIALNCERGTYRSTVLVQAYVSVSSYVSQCVPVICRRVRAVYMHVYASVCVCVIECTCADRRAYVSACVHV